MVRQPRDFAKMRIACLRVYRELSSGISCVMRVLGCLGWLSLGYQATAVEPVQSAPLLRVPVCVHLMKSTQAKEMETKLDSGAVIAILEKANEVWKSAGIRFDSQAIKPSTILELKEEGPVQSETGRIKAMIPKDDLSTTSLDLCFVREMTPNGFFYGEPVVVKETAKLKDVTGGREEHLGRVVAHELGHAMGLQHHEDSSNLMYPGIKGLKLTAAQIAIAREQARKWAR